jgi:hypothetical protein
MREARRQKALDQIDKLERALRNIGMLDGEVLMTGCFQYEDQDTTCWTEVEIADFLHALYHAVKDMEAKK